MKLPPFGKPLYELLQLNSRPNNDIYLFIGKNAWNEGKTSSLIRPERTLILPPFDSPFLYNWPVNECGILIYDSGESTKEYIEDIAICLLQSQAEIVRVIAPDFSYYGTFKKDFSHV